MNNNLLQIKFKQRLNKLASLDYDNISCWEIVEAFNKAQREWVRRQVIGSNIRKQGDGSTTYSIDDLQILLKQHSFLLTKSVDYYETDSVPSNYAYFKRLSADSTAECCTEGKKMTIYLSDVNDVDILSLDHNTKPSFDWGETFCTMHNNKLRIYTNGEFTITNPILFYYKTPTDISFANCVNIADNTPSFDVESEFKDDIVELIIDSAVAIIAGDIDNFNQVTRNQNNSLTNT